MRLFLFVKRYFLVYSWNEAWTSNQSENSNNKKVCVD